MAADDDAEVAAALFVFVDDRLPSLPNDAARVREKRELTPERV